MLAKLSFNVLLLNPISFVVEVTFMSIRPPRPFAILLCSMRGVGKFWNTPQLYFAELVYFWYYLMNELISSSFLPLSLSLYSISSHYLYMSIFPAKSSLLNPYKFYIRYSGIRANWARVSMLTMSQNQEILGLTEGVTKIRTQLKSFMIETTKRFKTLETQQTQFSSQLQET